MTAEFPWASVGVAMGYRGNTRVSTASATAYGTSTANATVVAMARAAVLSMAIFVVPMMETHGTPRQLCGNFVEISVAIRGHCHGNFRGRPTEAISTAIRGRLRPLPGPPSDTG